MLFLWWFVEILVVNDGSHDRTAQIAQEYQDKYPTIVKAVEKENGGHGDAVNCGLAHATGKYFKVVDSDDWVETDMMEVMLQKASGSPVDIIRERGGLPKRERAGDGGEVCEPHFNGDGAGKEALFSQSSCCVVGLG